MNPSFSRRRVRQVRHWQHRQLLAESLEERRVMAVDWRNPSDAFDVDNDHLVVPLDALLVINELNTTGPRTLSETHATNKPYFDTNGDQMLAPLDALLVINYLNASSPGMRHLGESNQIAAERSLTITLGVSTGSRKFQAEIKAQFDTTDQQAAIEDMLAVYLVDPARPDQTILDRGTPGTALFTLSGSQADYVPGLVRWDGSILEIDLSAIKTRDTGELKFQFLQNDTDTGGLVTIRPLSNAVDTTIAPAPAFPAETAQTPAAGIDPSLLTLATGIEIQTSNVRYNKATGRYAAELTLLNQGPALGANVLVTLPGLPANVSVHNPSGSTAGGVPYINFRSAIGGGGLASGAASRPVLVEFDVVGQTPFRLLPQVLAGPNHAPTLAALAPIVSKPGDWQAVKMTASDQDGDALRYSLTAAPGVPVRLKSDGTLVVQPTAAQVGNFTFSVTTTDGVESVARSVSLAVNADPNTNTRVSGKVLQTTGQPLANMRVEIGATSVLTASDGSFTLDLGTGPLVADTIKVRGELYPGSQAFPFIAEKLPLLLERALLPNVNNVIERAIYLPVVDVASGKQINPAQDITVTTAAIPGAEVFVAAGTLMNQQGTPFTGVLSITEVPVDLTPAALPANVRPDLLVTIQPGEMVFASPAPLTLPNIGGYAPGTILDLWSINPVTGDFDDVGDVQVSADGATAVTISGGIRNSSWHFTSPRPPAPKPPKGNPRNPPEDPCGCPGGGGSGSGGGSGGGGSSGNDSGSSGGMPFEGGMLQMPSALGEGSLPTGMEDMPRELPVPPVPPLLGQPPARTKPLPSTTPTKVDYASGAVIGTKSSASYISQGVSRETTLTYDSLRANPQPIVHVGFSSTTPDSSTYLVAKATVTSGSISVTQSGVAAGTMGLTGGENVWALPADGGDADAALQLDLRSLPTGRYTYVLDQGLLRSDGSRFTGTTAQTSSTLLSVNSIDSPFGAGWDLAGWQRLVENPDGTVMLIDGDGSEQLFRPPAQAGGNYSGPAGDFSVLKKLPNNTYQRTLKDQTVYAFNAQHRVATITDSNGNQNVYSYDGSSRLVKTTDPVGLETTFTYTGSRITSFTEPGNRTTQLVYDASGNLTEVHDPDGGLQSYGYDSNHLLTAKTDSAGNTEELVYDFAGRLSQSIGPDGAVRQFHPMQVDGLYPREATTNLLAPPVANPVGAPRSFVSDALGNVLSMLLDQQGQIVTSQDGAGLGGDIGRNSQNLVTQEVDARGHLTLYEYDANGNVTRLRDEISGASTLGTIAIAGEVDEYTFTAHAGDRLFYDALGIKPGDVRMTLTGPGGSALTNFLDADGDRGTFQLSETGDYRLKLEGNAGATGDYEFRVYLAPTTTAQLPIDTLVSGSITVPGGQNVYVFPGNIGDHIFLDNLTGSGDIRMTLVSPSGEYLFNFMSRNGDAARTLHEAGQYQLIVFGNGDAVGTYTFQVVTPTESSSPIALDTPISGAINEPGERRIYTFTANLGDRMFFDSLGGTGGDTRFDLISPDGVRLRDFSYRESDSALMLLTQSGTYQVVAYGNGDNVGTYNFRLVTPTQSITPVAFDTPITGSIDEPGERDIYTFTGAIGDRLYLDGLAGTGGDTRYNLVGPTGELLVNFQYRSNNSAPLRLDEAGTYQVIVYGNGDNVGGYSFNLVRPTTTTLPLTLDTTISGSIDKPADYDAYTFTGAAGDRLFLDNLGGSGGDVRMDLISPLANVPVSFLYRENDSGILSLQEAGEYTLLVYGNGDNTGTYSFRMVTPIVTPALLTFDTNIVGGIDEPGDQDVYSFAGAIGDRLFLNNLGGVGGDVRMTLQSPSGALPINFLYRESDSGPLTLTETGTYRLTVFGNGDDTGTYQFQLATTPLTKTPLLFGMPLSSTISKPGEYDSYTFSGSVGQQVYIDVTANPSANARYELIDPSGVRLANAVFANADRGVFTLTRAGQYQLLVYADGDATGSYSLQVLDAAAQTISLGAVTTANLATGASAALYRLNSAPGKRYQFDSQSNVSGIWSLIGRGGQVLASSTLNTDFAATVADDNGPYALLVSGNGGAPASFNFQVTDVSDASVTPSGLNLLQSGTITAGKVDTYTYQVQAGTLLYLDFQGTAATSLRGTLTAPGSQQLFFSDDLTDRFAIAPRSGTYSLVVTGDTAASTGAYSLKLANLKAAATPLTLGTAITGTLAAGRVDSFSFGGSAGDRLLLDTNITTGAALRYSIVSPSGDLFVSDSDLRGDSNALQLKETGQYEVLIFASGTTTGNYDFRLFGSNLSTSAASYDTTISGSIATPGQSNVYTFVSTAGQRVVFDAVNVPNSLHYDLVSPSGKFVAANADLRFDGSAFMLEETGTYQFIVDGGASLTGSYSFILSSATIGSTPININQTVANTITKAGEVDLYTFSGSAGQRVLFNAGAGNSLLRYHLLAPNGDYVINNTDIRYETDGFYLGQTGTYQVVVFGSDTSTGAYSFQISLGAVTTEAITLDQSVSSALTNPGDLKVYEFVANAGQRILFNVGAGNAALHYHLIDPLGLRVVNSADLRFDRDGFNLDQSGVYRLIVYASADATGSYNFQINAASINIVNAALDQSLAGSVAVPGEVDLYRFSGVAGQRVVFDSSSSANLYFTLISPTGTYLIQNGDIRYDRDPITLEESGVYQVYVFGFVDVIGAYDVRFTTASVNRYNTALDTLLSGSLAIGQWDQYYFSGSAGQRITVDAVASATDGVYYTLVSPSGRYLINSADSRYDRDAFHLEESGTFEIIVFEYGTGVGDYSLQVHTSTIATLATTLGAPLAGAIAASGELDVYTFSATAGQRVFIDSGLTTNSGLHYHLLSPTGVYVLSGANINADSSLFRLAETGAYRIVVYGDATNTGSYNLRVVDASTPTVLPANLDVAGQLNPGKSTRAYSINAQAGQHLYLDALASNSGGSWSLIDASNTVVTTQNIASDLEYEIAKSGSYLLLLSGASATPLDYRFRMTMTQSAAAPLVLGATVAGNIGAFGQKDSYTFQGGNGQRLWLDSLDTANLGLRISLTSPSGNVVHNNLQNNDGFVVLPGSGLYRLDVDGIGASLGSYQFRLLDLERASKVALGATINDNLTPGNATAVYRISGLTGQRLHFDDLGTSPLTGTWKVYAPGGILLSNLTLGVDFDLTLPAAGDYSLVVAGSGAASAQYQFQVTDISDSAVAASGFGTINSGTATGTPQNFIFSANAGTKVLLDFLTSSTGVTYTLRDPANNVLFNTNGGSEPLPYSLARSGIYTVAVVGSGAFSFRALNEQNAPLVANNVLTNGNLTATFQTDIYRIAGTPGKRVYLDMAGDTVGGDLSIALYSPSGNVLFSSTSNVGAGPVTFTESGNYLFTVGRQSTTGTYAFRVLDVVAAATLKDGVQVNDFVSRGVEADLYRLPVTVGAPLTFDGTSLTTGSRVSIYSPENALLDTRNIVADSTYTPTFTGEAVIVVDGVSPVSDAYGIRYTSPTFSVAPLVPATQPPAIAGGDLRYTYDSKFNKITSITDELGHVTLFGIDPANGNCTSVTRVIGAVGGADDIVTTYAYTAAGQVDTVTDPLGRITDYDYDSQGRVITVTYAKGTVDQGVVRSEYDAIGNVTASIDERNQRTTYAYNARNELISITQPDPDGLLPQLAPVFTMAYNAAGLLITESAPNGGSTQYQYDSQQRLVRTIDANNQSTQYIRDAEGNITTTIDRLGQRTSYAYDARNRIIGVTDALGNTTRLTYDFDNHLAAATDALGNTTTYLYDARGRGIATQDALGRRESWIYDAAGNITAFVDHNGNTTRYTYDELDRLLTSTNALGGVLTTNYDKAGNIVLSKDELNRATQFAYDARDRLKVLTDAQNQSLQYIYDAAGNLLSSKDQLNRTTSLQYDALDRVTTVIDPLLQSTRYTYDRDGNILSVTDALNRTTSYQYDLLDRLKQVTDPLGQQVGILYNANGNVTRLTDTLNRATTYEYDALDRPVKAMDAAGGITRSAYDSVGNLRSSTDELGRVTQFAYDAVHRRIRTTDALGQLTFNAYDNNDNLVEFTDELGRQTEYSYDALDRLQTVRDALGGVTAYTYDATDNLLSMTDTLGHQTAYAYDTLNQLTKLTDALAGQWNFTYDAVGNRTSAKDQLNRTTAYAYDALNRLAQVTDPLNGVTTYAFDVVGNVLSATDALSRTTNFAYDALNRLTRSTDALSGKTDYTYDAADNLLSIKDALNRTTSFAYDALDRQITMTDALGGIVTWTYDAVDNQTSVKDELNHTTSFSYDALRRLTRSTDALGGITNYAYDARGNLLTLTDALGHATHLTYDALDRQTSMTDALGNSASKTYDSQGNVTSITDELGRVSHVEYDALNRVARFTDALAGVANYAYDAASNLTALTDPLNRTTTFSFDALNRLKQSISPLGNTSTITYDAVGNPTAMTDALNHSTQLAYDALNRLTTVTDAMNGQSHYSYDAVGNLLSQQDQLNRTTQFGYDALNRKITETDPLAHVTTFAFDAASRLLSATDALNHATSYGYDALNRATSMTDPNSAVTAMTYDAIGNLLSVTDPLGNRTNYAYDAVNLLTQETNQNGDSRSYSYDPTHKLTAVVDREGRQRQFVYDGLNRMTAENWLDGSDQIVHSLSFSFDAASQLTVAGDAFSHYGLTYDSDGRQATLTNAGTLGVPTVAFTYQYDAADRLTTRGESINGVQAATNALTYDSLDRLTKVTQSGAGVATKRVDMAYNAASQVTGVARFTDLAGTTAVAQTAYTYDPAGRLTALKHGKGATTLAAYTWTYDVANRLTQASTPDGTANYAYDPLGQLTGVDNTSLADETYGYDANGNRNTAGYQTGTDNRLTSDGTYNYVYDKEGNRTRRTEIATGNYTLYQYDYRNRLIAITEQDSSNTVVKSSQYTYDVFDNRIAKSVDLDGPGAQPATIERYVYDGAHIAVQFDGGGNVTHQYLHGPMIDQILADDAGQGGVLWALTDDLGSVRDLADSSGNIVNHITYDSFGRIIGETNPAVDHLFAFTGRERDDESGLYFYRARFYDPVIGRFISQDPIGFAAGDANLYRYVGNAGTMFTDPSGLKMLQGHAQAGDGSQQAQMDTSVIPVGDFIPGLKAETPQLAPIPPELHASKAPGPSQDNPKPRPQDPPPKDDPPGGDNCPPKKKDEDDDPPPPTGKPQIPVWVPIGKPGTSGNPLKGKIDRAAPPTITGRRRDHEKPLEPRIKLVKNEGADEEHKTIEATPKKNAQESSHVDTRLPKWAQTDDFGDLRSYVSKQQKLYEKKYPTPGNVRGWEGNRKSPEDNIVGKARGCIATATEINKNADTWNKAHGNKYVVQRVQVGSSFGFNYISLRDGMAWVPIYGSGPEHHAVAVYPRGGSLENAIIFDSWSKGPDDMTFSKKDWESQQDWWTMILGETRADLGGAMEKAGQQGVPFR